MKPCAVIVVQHLNDQHIDEKQCLNSQFSVIIASQSSTGLYVCCLQRRHCSTGSEGMAETSREAYFRRVRSQEIADGDSENAELGTAGHQSGGTGRPTAEVFKSSAKRSLEGIADLAKPGFDRFVPAKNSFDENKKSSENDSADKNKSLFDVLQEARQQKQAEIDQQNSNLAPQLTLDEGDREFLRKMQEKEEEYRSAQVNEEDTEIMSFRNARANLVREIDEDRCEVQRDAQQRYRQSIHSHDESKGECEKEHVGSVRRKRPSIASDVLKGRTVAVKKRKETEDDPLPRPEQEPLSVNTTSEGRAISKCQESLHLVVYEEDDGSSSSENSRS